MNDEPSAEVNKVAFKVLGVIFRDNGNKAGSEHVNSGRHFVHDDNVGVSGFGDDRVEVAVVLEESLVRRANGQLHLRLFDERGKESCESTHL